MDRQNITVFSTTARRVTFTFITGIVLVFFFHLHAPDLFADTRHPCTGEIWYNSSCHLLRGVESDEGVPAPLEVYFGRTYLPTADPNPAGAGAKARVIGAFEMAIPVYQTGWYEVYAYCRDTDGKPSHNRWFHAVNSNRGPKRTNVVATTADGYGLIMACNKISNLNAKCGYPGNSIVASWNNETDVQYYTLWLDDATTSSGWSGCGIGGDQCFSPIYPGGGGTTSISIAVNPSHIYRWGVNFIAYGVAYTGATGTSFQCQPNCAWVGGNDRITVGKVGIFTAQFASPNGYLKGALWRDGQQLNYTNYGDGSTATWGTMSTEWTPTAADVGTHTIWCRAWNDGVAECRASGYGSDPAKGLYVCKGPDTTKTVTVVAAITPPPTLPPPVSASCSNVSIPSSPQKAGNDFKVHMNVSSSVTLCSLYIDSMLKQSMSPGGSLFSRFCDIPGRNAIPNKTFNYYIELSSTAGENLCITGPFCGDGNAPSVPDGRTLTCSGSGTPGRFNVTYSYGSVPDSGCAGLNSGAGWGTYWAQIANNSAFSSVLNSDNTWGTEDKVPAVLYIVCRPVRRCMHMFVLGMR